MSIEVGKNIQGKVTGLANFGAFVEIEDGKTGLVHISEVSDRYIENINDELEVGQEVTVKVVSVDNNKIGLSIRQAQRTQEKRTESDVKPMPQKPAFKPKKSELRESNLDALMNSFLKESEDRLSDLRRSTEGKRGGRGGRRN